MQAEQLKKSNHKIGGEIIRRDINELFPQLRTTSDGEEGNALEEEGNALEDVVRDEEEVPHQRLREQLGREPTEDEVKEWLRQHTEGY